jgi:ribosomal protein S18 acetylase RimI-like enzyme
MIAPGERLSGWSVRQYRPADAASVRHVYAETAFFGEPVEAFFEDRELFADLGVAPYLLAFPEHIFVAQAGAQVVGYVLGSPSGEASVHRARLRLLPAVLLRAVLLRYRIGRRSLRYFAANLLAFLHGELLEVRDPRFPANLHSNVLGPYRGQGIGRALICRYLEHLQEAGVPGVHLVTTELNEAALHLYESLGFELLAQRQTNVWRPYLGRSVLLLAYGRKLR